MSKAVLISIQPKWCALIANGEKTVEVRKSKPKLSVPFKCYIYQTSSGKVGTGLFLADGTEIMGRSVKNGKVIGEFVCNEITFLGNISTDRWDLLQGSIHESHKRLVTEKACLTESELLAYGGKYAWHISNLVIYDKPQELNWFVVEGDCDCMNCKKCSWFNRGNGYNVEDDCDLGYENLRWKESFKPLFRAPQSWCYVEDLMEGGQADA